MITAAHIIVGLGFGDEGKGITTDYLCSLYQPEDTIVVRYNGGQQAGHTVMIDGQKHIHSNFGSGTLRGFNTFISKYCTMYPVAMRNEYRTLMEKGITNIKIIVDPLTIITTPADVAWNRMIERTKNRHGTCGLGVGATMKRHHESPIKFRAIELKHSNICFTKIYEILKCYYQEKLDKLYSESKITIHDVDFFHEVYNLEMDAFDRAIKYLNNIIQYSSWEDVARKYKTAIFEGAQGIMLDMEYGFFPYVTYSHCTSKNAVEMCNDLKICSHITWWYITRCYQTRHGKGPMTTDEGIAGTLINNEEEINLYNQWQGDFLTGEFDLDQIMYSIDVESIYGTTDKTRRNLMITCLDQRPGWEIPKELFPKFGQIHVSNSPYSKNIKRIW